MTTEPTFRYFNLNQLVSVRVDDFEENAWIKVVNKSYFLGFKIRNEGFVETIFKNKTELPDNCIVKDSKVYYKPCITCKFSNGQKMINFFNNYEIAQMCADNYMRHAQKVIFIKETSP